MTQDDLKAALEAVLGPKGVISDASSMEPYLTEERGRYWGTAALVARPASTEEVAEVVRICAERDVPIVPQGGNTGLVGGAVPDGGVVLSLGRMKTIRALDPVNQTITVDAGCILADIQTAADEAGFLFPLSLAAEGSCQIGGNLATNAGGV
ncbi:MAG: FAD-binding oxidoreductase, partial [Rhodospirillales bacterium]|nr:FAD-binding oxidoreductase [Rhodospirillales bacterium]